MEPTIEEFLNWGRTHIEREFSDFENSTGHVLISKSQLMAAQNIE